MYQISIVVPTYNESQNIEKLFERVDAVLKGIPYELVFVDDSTDNTPDVISELQKEHSNIVLRHRDTEKGLATAVLLGFSIASGKYIAVMDADLQHPPEILRSMYAVLLSSRSDFCIPSRFIPGGSDGGLNLYRKFVSATARYMGKIALRSLRNVSDPTSGLFMFRRSCIKNADLQPIGWKIMAEVLAMAHYRSICEIPYTFCERNAGESKLSKKVTEQYIIQLHNLRKRELRRRNVRVTVFSDKEVKKYLKLLK